MNSDDPWSGFDSRAGLLIDTNLLVLFVVGGVNRDRIESFKRTRQYSKTDYQLLLRVLDGFEPLYTLAHVMAEVSNLTDLTGRERLQARQLLKETLTILREPEMPSVRAAQSAPYESLGLVDAAIAALAREYKCTVLTDDLDLYLALSREGIMALNFAHLRERNWGV
jgi:predicted nucleic acid-binding protein